MFSTGTLSFQESQQIRPGDNMSLSIDTIKCFIAKIQEKYSLKKKSNSQENSKSLEPTANEVIETIVKMRINQLVRKQ